MLAVDTIRFGRAIRALRRREALRQADVGQRAGVSDTTISRIERGIVGPVAFARLRRIGEAVGAEIELNVRWRGEELDRLLDEAHAGLVDAAVALLGRAGWDVRVEATFAVAGERGSIDVLAWHASTRLVLVGEVKSVVPDAQAMIATLDRKARLAPSIAADRGWQCTGVARVLFVGEGRTSRARIERHAAMFEAAFPVRGRAALGWIREPAPASPPSALLFLDTLPADGRRCHRVSSDSRRVTVARRLSGSSRVSRRD